MKNICEISVAEYPSVIDFAINSKKNLMIFGPAGIGKTEMVMQQVQKKNMVCLYWNMTTMQPPDLVGLPIVSDFYVTREGKELVIKKTQFAPPEIMPTDLSTLPVVVLVDELDKAIQDIQNPLLEVFQFRRINGLPLNIQAIVATGNLPDENAFSQPISHALANRCINLKLREDLGAWTAWASAGDKVEALFLAFLQSNAAYFKRGNTDPFEYSNPSPRSWFEGSDIYRKFRAQTGVDPKDKDVKKENYLLWSLIGGSVGREAMIKLKVWHDILMDSEELITQLVKNGKLPKIEGGTDHEFVIAIGALDRCKNHEEYSNVFKWLVKCPPNIQVGAIKCCITKEKLKKHKVQLSDPNIAQVMIEISKILGIIKE